MAGRRWWVVGDRMRMVCVVDRGCHHPLYLFMSAGRRGAVVVGRPGLHAMVW